VAVTEYEDSRLVFATGKGSPLDAQNIINRHFKPLLKRAGRAALNRTTSATGELTREEILDNITLYWLTNTGVSASRLYWEYKGGFFNAKGVSIPVAASVFPGEAFQAPRSWTERAYPNLIYFNEVDKGGHFAAWEQPQLFSEEVRAAFRSLRYSDLQKY
jgi:pimeloyl-ACP methyl ester carboxylesterase